MSNNIKAIEEYLIEREAGVNPSTVIFDFTLAVLRKLPVPKKEYIIREGNE
ncbi:MAG: hypothetical protein ACI9CE_003960 [Flavobacterium sp.]|jgi:hypothetical protein